MDAARVSAQLLPAGTALAGLILVFLGNVVSAFNGYETEHREAAKALYRWPARLAFAGFCAALLTVIFSLAFNWFASACVVYGGVVTLIIAMACVFVAALRAVIRIG